MAPSSFAPQEISYDAAPSSQRVPVPGITITSEVGRGPHGIDYRARCGDRGCLLRVAADSSPESREHLHQAFRSQVIALARARHPTVPAVLEMGSADERPYAIIDWPEGQTLAERLRWGPLPEASIIPLAARLLGGLFEAHRLGLVHGSITPSRIVFVDDEEDVRLAGFGAARAGRDAQDASGARGDLAALGRVLYECASGRSAVAGVPDSPRRVHDELPELSGGNEPLLSGELSKLIASLMRCDSQSTSVDASALLRSFERLGGRGETSTSELPSAAEATERSAHAVPLVGRASQLKNLQQTWSETRAGKGGIVHVRGTAGSGKSRLIEAFLTRASAPPDLLLKVQCVPGDARPFATLNELVKRSLRSAGESDAPVAGEPAAEASVRHAGREMASLLKHLSPELARVFAEGTELGATHELQALFAEGAAEFLSRLLQSAKSAIVLIEDLQWMDPGSRTVLTRVVDRADDVPVLFVVTSRTDETSVANAELFFRPIRAPHVLDCPLSALDNAECLQLVEAYLGASNVPADVTGPLVSLGDGTPLSMLELLHAITAEGLLVPFWGTWRLDRSGLDQVRFPRRTRETLARRVAGLSPATRRVLEAAAVLGSTFDEAFLAGIVERDDCAAALREARDARVLLPPAGGAGQFVHESVREALLAQMEASEVRAVHQRIAEKLDAESGAETSLVCRRAAAYAAGDWERARDRVFATNYEAGLQAFASFDNDRALAFLTVAERAAEQASIQPDARFHQTLGEVYVRRGALARGRDCFDRALAVCTAPLDRSALFARVAWVRLTMGETAAAWRAFEDAFASLSQPMPPEAPLDVVKSLLSWRTLQRATGLGKPTLAPPSERVELEALSALHYQTARLALETNHFSRFLVHILACIDRAERLGPSRALVRSLLVYGFALVATGLRAPGLARLAEAEQMAEQIRDPVISAYCLQLRSVVLGWSGDLDGALDANTRLLAERGHWLELSEYSLVCASQALMFGLRGQSQTAWQWIERAIDKVRHEAHPTESSVYLEHAARAALAALGREGEAAEAFRGVLFPAEPSVQRSQHQFAYGPRLRTFTETGNLGPEFEAVVKEVRAAIPDPKRAHLGTSEFYLHLVSGRIHQALRAAKTERRALLPELSRCARDLRSIARIAILQAHAAVADGYEALFQGAHLRASLLFWRAEEIAQQENCPAVLYAVARGRAHLLREQGKSEPALLQARLAATIADAQGQAHRLRWIHEEFPSLAQSTRLSGPPSAEDRVATDSGLVGRSLEALVRVTQDSPPDLNLTGQIKRIVDQLLECLHGQRGVLFLAPEGGGLPIAIASRDQAGRDLPLPDDGGGALVLQAFEAARIVLEPRVGPELERPGAVVATPLCLRERVIGVVLFETYRWPLSDEDRHVLEIFASQAAVAIELTRALRAHVEELRERKLLEDELRQAQKMEAIGRLAGTIAHDFNNLLAIITATLDCVRMDHGDLLATELADIRDATDRAAALTGQLLTFARRQVPTTHVIQLNAILRSAVPLVRRLLPENVEFVTSLESTHDAILADPSRLEQALLNLCANARDAMPNGGRLSITTRDDHAAVGAGTEAEDCVVLSVADNGQGMPPEVLRQAFEPFFTTKFPGKGTGLGLSTVYGIVQQMRGRIAVESAVGAGTTFSMYLPRALTSSEGIRPANDRSAPPPPPLIRSGIARRPDTVLLVDDERFIVTALERGLVREGYRVVSALSGQEALELVTRGNGRIDALVTDVLMPGMSGPELVERLAALGHRPPHLFMSGYTDDALVAEQLHDADKLLIKPFTVHALVDRIRMLLQDSDAAAEAGA